MRLLRNSMLSLVCLCASTGSTDNEVQVGRYVTIRPLPTLEQTALLQVVVSVHFPGTVQNLRDAVRHLLRRSGYSLLPDDYAPESRKGLLALSLPDAHRSLGPITLSAALATLAGPAWRLIDDPIHRLVTFERCSLSDKGTEDQ